MSVLQAQGHNVLLMSLCFGRYVVTCGKCEVYAIDYVDKMKKARGLCSLGSHGSLDTFNSPG